MPVRDQSEGNSGLQKIYVQKVFIALYPPLNNLRHWCSGPSHTKF